jgi:hypothetical protein
VAMHDKKISRRLLFILGGAALGAGVATTVGATTLLGAGAAPGNDPRSLQKQLAAAADREAIRALQVAFTRLIEEQQYEAAADLFDESASLDLSGVTANGRIAIGTLFTDQYRHQTVTVMHSAYRPNALQSYDALAFSDDQRHATAVYHLDVAVCAPLQGECTAVQMARLPPGQTGDRRWESGRLVAKYVKVRGHWKMASLSYSAS